MKPVKFIVFAHPTTKCDGEEKNFIELLNLNYQLNNGECAIGLNWETAEKIIAPDDKYDIFLFNDKGERYTDNEYFLSFADSFYTKQAQFDFRLIFHFNSKWDINNFFVNNVIDEDFENHSETLNWLIELPSIKQSHINTDAYAIELATIAKAILNKNKNSYTEYFNKLDSRFGNPILEAKLSLLHHCLTPKGMNNAEWLNDKITLKDEDEVVFFGKIGSRGKEEFDNLKKANGDDYLSKLTVLRNILLSDY